MMEDHSKHRINHLRPCFFAALFMLFFVSAPVLAGTIVVNNKIQRQSEYVNLGRSKKVGAGYGALGSGGGFYFTNSTYNNNILQKPYDNRSKAFVPETKNLSGRLSYGFWFADSGTFDISKNAIVKWIEEQHSRGTYSLLADIKYHFVNESTWVPYLGLQAGAALPYYKDVHDKQTQSTSIGGGALAGVEIFVTERASLFAEYNFLAFRQGSPLGNGDVNGDNDMAYQNGILLGFQCYW
jgi:hypothetical protein